MMADHPNAIALEKGDDLGLESAEVVRAWINDEGFASVWIAAFRLEGPENFGRFLADVARHGALAYSSTWTLDENLALQGIVAGLSEQLRDQFTNVETIQEGELH